MRSLLLLSTCVLLVLPGDALAQRRASQRKPAAAAAPKNEPAHVQCREALGTGARTKAS